MSSDYSENAGRFPLYNKVRNNHDIRVYIDEQNKSMHAMGYTEHSFAHIGVVAERTGYILETLGKDDHMWTERILKKSLYEECPAVNRALIDRFMQGE